VDERAGVTTILFTDIEGSTRLWESDPDRMREALARHDAVARDAVVVHRGRFVKSTGDGIHAVFDDAADGVAAALAIERLVGGAAGLALRVRCGLHAGPVEMRDNDCFGSAVNRAARIMAIAHGGQVLLSNAVADLARAKLPADASMRDLGAVRLRDLAGVERVFQLVHPALRIDFPPVRSLESTPNNLPQPLSTFVRRDDVLDEARSRMRASRLLTLLGPGGLGKTRLALQLAAEALDGYADGAWFVDLAPLADASLVPQAIAAVLGVKEEPARRLEEALVRFVRDRELLLVLDNCEHVIAAAAAIAHELLRGGPRLKIVATSRQALHVPGETGYAVPALSVPASDGESGVEALRRCEAVQLFVDRATAIVPSFRLDARNAASVAAICRHLDGIPLAIELAAARLRVLPVESIARRLGDMFALLSAGERTALPRQRTLRALIDWSHDALLPGEQALFRRLAVFAGGFGLDAAEAVGTGDGVSTGEVLDLIAGLVDKSLVVPVDESGRYRLLETVRQYADQKLRAAGEARAARDAHLRHYLALAEAVRPEYTGAHGADDVRRMDMERENLLAAHAWCAEPHVPASTGHRFVHATKPYWWTRAVGLGSRLLDEAAARGAGEPPARERALALLGAGQFAAVMGDYRAAQRHLVQALEIGRAVDASLVPDLLHHLAWAEMGLGHAAAARALCVEALDGARRLGSPLAVAGACIALGQAHRLDGDIAAAVPLYEEALAVGRADGNAEYVAGALLNLAMSAISRGDAARARDHLREAAATAEASGSVPNGLCAVDAAAALAAIEGDYEGAALFAGIGDAGTRERGLTRDPVDEAFLAPLVARARDALASQAFDALHARGAAIPYERGIADVRAWLEGRSAAPATSSAPSSPPDRERSAPRT
jgi:predicted ATPase/class 3 adenylate cyclase